MERHGVTFVVDHRLTDDELDALLGAVDDATPIRERDRTVIHVDREAATYDEAITTALRDFEGVNLSVVAVRAHDLEALDPRPTYPPTAPVPGT